MRLPDVSPLAPGATVWAYLRDSGGESQERSVDQQIQLANEYCVKHQLVLQELFPDRARQGSNTDARTELNRMLGLARELFPQVHDRKRREEVAAKLNHGIIFWRFNRLGRDSIETSLIRSDLRMRGLTLISLSDGILTGNAAIDPIIEAIIDYKSQMDVDVIAGDTLRGLHSVVSMRDSDPKFLLANPGHQSTGRYLSIFPGRMAPRGFIFEKICIGTRRDGHTRMVQRLIPDQECWDRALLAWRMRVMDRASVPQIHEATHLYPKANGYTNLFRNRIYTGVFKFGDQMYGTPEDPFVTPLIPEEWYFIEAERREVRDMRRQKGGKAQPGDIDPRIHSRGRLLSGLMVCARCGANIHAASEGDRIRAGTDKMRKGWAYYQCSAAKQGKCSVGSIGALRLEGAVVEKLHRDVLTLDRLRLHADRLVHNIDTHRRTLLEELEALRSTLVEAEKRTDNIADALAQRPSSAVLLRRLDAEESAMHMLQHEIQAKQADLAYWASFEVDDAELERIAARINEALMSGDVRRSRLAISTFIQKIEAEPRELIHLKIYYTFPHPDSLGTSESSSLPLRPAKLNLRRRPKRRDYPSDLPKAKRGSE